MSLLRIYQIIILVFFINTYGQEIIGIVENASDSKVITNAHVLNLNKVKMAITDNDGRFFIDADVNDTLYISYLGFKSIKIRVSNDLIKYPNKPIKDDPDISYHSTREYVFTKPENPITYPKKLLRYNFEHQDTFFYNFHVMPPLIRNKDKKMLDISKKLEIKYSQDWRGMFLASTFVTISQFN